MKRLITICAAAIMLLTVNVDVKAEPRLLLHFDDNMNDSSGQNHSITPYGDAQLDTAHHAAGSASLLLDGAGDYLTSLDSPDWDICASNADDWTVSFYVRLDTHTGTTGLMYQGSDANNQWSIRDVNGHGLTFSMKNSGSELIWTGYGGDITDSDWHWIALCKVDSNYAIYKDGTQVNYTSDTDTANFTGLLNIGRRASAAGKDVDGNIDEVMIYHANVFGACPLPTTDPQFLYSRIIPEPATICLLGLGALSLIRSSRRRREPEPGRKRSV